MIVFGEALNILKSGMTSVFSSLPSTQTLDTGRQLVSQGPQLLCKLFGLKAQLLLLPNRQKYLKDSEWNKLRYRLEKRFPALPDFDKVSCALLEMGSFC